MEEMEKFNNIEEKEINEDNLSDVAGGANRRPRSIYTNFLHTDNNLINEDSKNAAVESEAPAEGLSSSAAKNSGIIVVLKNNTRGSGV